jgi:hypothetical protein
LSFASSPSLLSIPAETSIFVLCVQGKMILEVNGLSNVLFALFLSHFDLSNN